MKKTLRYFGKPLKGTWRAKEQYPVTVTTKNQLPDPRATTTTTDTQTDFVFDVEGCDRAIRIERSFKELREDPPGQIVGHGGAKAPLADPAGLAVAIYADGKRETVFVKDADGVPRSKPQVSKRATKKKARAGRQGGPKPKYGREADKNAAVKLVIKLRKGPQHYKMEAACEQALRDYPALNWPSGWHGLHYWVMKKLKARGK